MAKMKIVRTPRGEMNVTPTAATEDDEPVARRVKPVAEEAEPVAEVAEVEEQQVEVAVAPTSADGNDLVRILMLRPVSPPPTIGHWKGQMEMPGISTMDQGKEFVVPSAVGHHLAYTGAATVLSR